MSLTKWVIEGKGGGRGSRTVHWGKCEQVVAGAGSDWAWLDSVDEKPLAVKNFGITFEENASLDSIAEVIGLEVGVGTEFGDWEMFPVKVFKAEKGVVGEQVVNVLE